MKRVEFTADELYLYYDAEEVTKRLGQVGSMPLTVVDVSRRLSVSRSFL